MKNSYERPKGLIDDYEIIFIDRFCQQQCFKSYGGCSSFSYERQVIDINKIISRIQSILKRKPKAKIFLDAPNFIDVDYRRQIPEETENQHIKLLRAIIKSGIKAHLRIETTVYSLIDKKSDFYQLLKDAGIKEVWLGVESGNRKLRDKYNKPSFTNKQLKQITQNLHKEEIFCCWYLIVGFEDTDKTAIETADLIKKVEPDRIFLSQLLPYEPGEQYIDFEKLKRNIAKIEKYRKIFQNLAEEISKSKK